jgi:hypothetical protein
MEKAKQNNISGIVGTILFHAILFILLIFMGFSVKLPLPAEQGMEINFGYDETGQGEIESGQSSSSSQETQEAINSDATNGTEKQTLTQDFQDAVALKNKSNPKLNNSTTDQKNQEEQKVIENPKPNPNALFPGKGTGNGTSGSGAGNSDGNTGGTGNQGSQDGGDGKGNGGSGNGISYSLGGRTANGLPKPEYNIQEEGKVVVEIIVDRNGTVVRATAGMKGTTTMNKTLWNNAKKAALNTHFNKKNDAAEEQKGFITYHFELQ